MSMGKSKNSSSQSFDPELKGLLIDTFREGQRVSRTPYSPYNFATVAPLSPAQLEGMNMTADTARAGVGQQEINDAIATTRAETGFQAPRVTAGAAIGSTNVSDNFGFNPITNQQVQGQGVAADQVGQTSPVGVGNIASQAVTAQQIGPLGRLNAQQVGQTNAVQTNRIGVDPITAQQVQGQTVGAQSLARTDLTPYQNQYTTGVVDAALGDLDRARQMTQNQNAASAVSAGAYGGSRDALVRAETNRAFADQAAKTAVNLRSQGFQNAQQQAQADLNRAQQAGAQTAQFGQQANLANQQANLQAATTSGQFDLQGQTETGRQALQSGLAAQQQNTQRALANQQASLTAGVQNLQADLARRQANQNAALAADRDSAARAQQASQQMAQMGLQSGLAAQDANMRADLANQQANLAAGTTTAANLMRADQLNAANNLAAQQATQQGAIQAAQFGQRGELANQDAAMRAALANQNARMQAQSLNQTAGLQASGMRQGAANQLANLGGDLRGTQFADAAALQGVGAQQQAAAQQLLDDRYRRFAEQREYPFRMFDVLRSGAGLLPNPLTSSSKGRSTNLGLPA